MVINNIQYDENIYYLKLMLNSIDWGINSNINRELFQKKIKEDLIFICKCKNILLDKLLKNDKLITRNTLLQNIRTLIDQYQKIQSKTTELNIINNDFFKEIDAKHIQDCNRIENILLKVNETVFKEDLTTNKELNILLMDTDFEDEN